MRFKVLFLILLIVSLVVPAFSMGETEDLDLSGAEAIDFTLPNLSGEEITLSDYQGKVVFLNFWATWCPPCRKEMPSMQKLYEKLKGKDFEMLAVAMDRSGQSVVAPFVKEGGYTFPILLNPSGAIASKYMVRGIPATFIIDKQGRIIDRVVGARNWDSDSVIKKLKLLMRK